MKDAYRNLMNAGLTRRAFAIGLAAGSLAALAGPAFAQDKRFAGRKAVAGLYATSRDIVQAEVCDWLQEKSGAEVSQVFITGSAAYARMKAEAANPEIDLYSFSGEQEQLAKAEGLTATIDAPTMAKLPANMRDPDSQWASWGVLIKGFIYRTDKISTPPTSYKDLLDPRYRGHIALPDIGLGHGRDLLVMLARTQSGDEKNVDGGFDMLKKIAVDTPIIKTPAEVQTQFVQNDIWLVPYDAAMCIQLQSAGLPVAYAAPVEGVTAGTVRACIAKASQNVDVSSAIIDRLLSPQVQGLLAEKIGWLPTNPETTLPSSLSALAAGMNQVVELDRETMNKSLSAWTERWNREIASR